MLDWSPSLPAFASENLSAAVASSRAAVVFVWAAWDPVCQLLDRKLHSAQSDYPNLHFAAMNLDQEQFWPLALEWGVQDTRALACFVGGRLHELVIIQDLEALAKAKLSDWNKFVEEQKETQ